MAELDCVLQLPQVKLAFGRAPLAALQVVVPAPAEHPVEDHPRKTVVEPQRPPAGTGGSREFDAH